MLFVTVKDKHRPRGSTSPRICIKRLALTLSSSTFPCIEFCHFLKCMGCCVRITLLCYACPSFGQVCGLYQHIKNCPFCSVTVGRVMSPCYCSPLHFLSQSQPGGISNCRSSSKSPAVQASGHFVISRMIYLFGF